MLEALLAALFGLIIGSFLNVCIYRLPRDLSVVRPRSYCPHCERPIRWHENVPLLSYLLLRAKCPGCGGRISWRYPALELSTAALFFFWIYVYGPTPFALKFCIFSAILVTLIFSDLEERILPDEFTKGGIVAGILLAAVVQMDVGLITWLLPRNWPPWTYSVAEACFGAAVTSGILWGTGALYEKVRHREGLGFGDVKMVAMMGAFLGLQQALMAICAGAVMGSILGVAYIAIAGKDASKYELPFGSFLGLAALGTALLAARGPAS